MKNPLKASFLFLLLIPSFLFAQHKNVSSAAEPAWVTRHQYKPDEQNLDKYAEEGTIDLLYEEQINVGQQVDYVHRTIKIISAAGVQNGSEVSVSFDPTFQRLAFHTLRVIRNNTPENKLNLSTIKVIQKEKDRNDFLYDGSLNAVSIMEDIRVGDIIDYSYSVQGFNPIFKGKYAAFLNIGFSIPMYDLYYKLIVPEARTVNIKSFNDTIQPTITTANRQTTYEWTKTNLKPLKTQDKTPSWYDPYPEVMISEFANWKEVNDWAIQLVPKAPALSTALAAAIKKIDTENLTTEKKIQATLRFVQDEIRYMGYEMGEHSHKPADPSKVFAQRFGDCKEKSYLLCTMLGAMHINADPVLINTSYKKEMAKWLPSSSNFDHMTVRVNIDNRYYFFDPTISYQRGNVKELYYPDYQVGLVLTDTTTALTSIPFRQTSSQEIKNLFTVEAMYGKGNFTVTTISKGAFADGEREDFKNSSNFELLKNYKKFYAAYYSDIIADSLNYFDDDSTGIFTSVEYYTIPKFWKSEKDVQKFSMWPFIIESVLNTPTDKQRNMPLRLQFPGNFKETVQVNLPEDWKFKPVELHVKNNCFSYNMKTYGLFTKAYMEIDYKNVKNHVAPEEIKKYLEDIKYIEDNSTYVLTYGDKEADDDVSSNTKRNWVPVVVVIGSIIGFAVWSQRRR